MGVHDPRLTEIDCATAHRDLSLLVDCECDDACRSRLEHHLASCSRCRERFLAEQRLKAKLSRSCCEKAPSGLREKLMVQIRSTTVRTTMSDGTTVIHSTTTVERREST